MVLAPGLSATVELLVGDGDTATALGSGDVPVLGTPRLLARAEAVLTEVDGRSLTFRVTAADGNGPVADATVVRVVVDRARFLERLR